MVGESLLKPFTAESQCSKSILDFFMECSGLIIFNHSIYTFWLHHIVTAVRGIENLAFTSRSESLNGEKFTLLHFCFVTIVNSGHRFTCVDDIRVDRMSTEI
jgi:hypothetical protein